MIHKKYKKFPYKIENGILLIPITNQSKIDPEYYAKASLEDKDKLLQYTYSIHNGRSTKYAKSGENPPRLMHSIVFGEKVSPGFDIDHIDRDGLNNTRENLREITKSANAQNKDKKPGCSSQYIGASKSEKKWTSNIKINKKNVYLGMHEKEIDAGKFYDVYAINHHGPTCKTNELLTEDEINDIIENGIPEKYIIKRRNKKDLDLPKHITREGEKYKVGFYRKDLNFRKVVDTLEKAIELRDKHLLEIKLKEDKKETERRENIIRNSDGHAVIYIKNKNKEIVYEIIVDDHVWPDVSSFSWSLVNKYYGHASNPDVVMHRYIYQRYVGKIPEGKSIDHIESSRIFDNRISNLRLADASLQNHNKEKDKNSVDKYKCVYFVKGSFSVIVNQKVYGCYDNAEEAAVEANEIFRKIYGENAFQNKIDFSVKTTKHNRIKHEDVTEEYINNIKLVKDLRNIIMIKKLNNMKGGPIKVNDLNIENIEEFKTKVINLLFKEMYDPNKKEINEDYIMKVKHVTELKKIISTNKLNIKSGGPLKIHDLKTNTLDEFKIKVIDLLFKS